MAQIFATTDDLRLAAECSFMKDGRGMEANKLVEGGKSKLYHFAEAEYGIPKERVRGLQRSQQVARCSRASLPAKDGRIKGDRSVPGAQIVCRAIEEATQTIKAN